MKKQKIYITTLFLLILCGPIASVFGREKGRFFDRIETILRAGNAKAIAHYMDASVYLNITGEKHTYTRTQAEGVLLLFFKKNPSLSFDIVHTGSSKEGFNYAIGQYISHHKKYSILVRVKWTRDRYLIYEMSFIKE